MDPSDEELYAQLLGYLAAEGAIEEDPEADVVVLHEFEHRALDVPLRLHVTPSSFGRHLREAAPDSAGAYPDVPPIDAAWRLFTIHLLEAVGTARPGETELVPGRGGVFPLRPDMTRTTFAPEVEQYIALDQYREKLLQHYADRGELEIDVHDEIFIVHILDGRVFEPALRVHVSSEELRRQMRSADDPDAAWRRIVDHIDAQARVIDPGRSELELGPEGILARHR